MELKFRAWDGKEFVYSDDEDYEGHETDGEALSEFFGDNFGCDFDQFIGVKDKNGKEIYNGDILGSNESKLLLVVWNEKFASFGLRKKGWMFMHYFGEACKPDDVEIVGNIRMNPELL